MAAYLQRFLYYAFNPWLNLAKIQTELGVYPAEVLGHFYMREMIVSITALMTAVKLYGSSDTESRGGHGIPSHANIRYFPICRILKDNYCGMISTKACSRVACCFFGFLTLDTNPANFVIPSLAAPEIEYHLRIGVAARRRHMLEHPGTQTQKAAQVLEDMKNITLQQTTPSSGPPQQQAFATQLPPGYEPMNL
ncbi:hypothetical protein Tcan_05136 [Toxocara canis]|uniref:Uncharacterized protein n=1 Tax=Toxocara canis TaxID=6265 RepID=A0A0B2V6W0_TOXCA|nr:hypothetical protein Tcan_05136 [Toxocara canis]